jgi:anti-sigma factor RsiW
MNSAAHPGDRLVDFVDGRLDAAGAGIVRAHLDVCDACRAVEAELRNAVAASAVLRDEAIEMPADLLASVSRALDAETPRRNVVAGAAVARIHPLLRGIVAAAAAAALVMLYLQVGTPPRALDAPAQAARDFGAVASRSLPLAIQTSDAAVLERYFADTPGPRVRVIDLAMMDIVLEGGARYSLAGHASALYSYRTPSGARLVCQMYDGLLSDLPPPQDVRDENGFRFQIYKRGSVTLVFWQEGELVCVLASELPASEVVALAVAKAMAPA